MGWCFRDPSLHDDIRRCAMSVGIRSRIARLAGLCGCSCAPNAMSHSRRLAATSLCSCARLRLRGSPPKASLYYGAFGFPCNTTATHPAAPLGSRRRCAPPLSFATRNLQKWQEVNEDELCDEIFTSNFSSSLSGAERSK